MVINHLLTGMVLQVPPFGDYSSKKVRFVSFRESWWWFSNIFCLTFWWDRFFGGAYRVVNYLAILPKMLRMYEIIYLTIGEKLPHEHGPKPLMYWLVLGGSYDPCA